MSRKWVGRREVGRRQQRIRDAIAAQLVELRSERGVSQIELAIASGVDRAHLSRVERARAAASIDVLVAVAANLGADVSIRLFPTAAPGLRDRTQAPMVEALVKRLHPSWRSQLEVPVPDARGVIDLVLRRRDGTLAIACEAHSQLRSIDLVVRRLHEKTLALGRLEPGPTTTVSSILLVRSTEATRRIVRLHAAMLAGTFPGRHADAIRALTDEGTWPGPTLLWVKVEATSAALVDRSPRGIGVGNG